MTIRIEDGCKLMLFVRSLFTGTLRPDLRRWNGSCVPQVGTEGLASEFA
jgi:hypothetical protein